MSMRDNVIFSSGLPYEDLAHAIIVRAAVDYESALKRKNASSVRECERFFTGEFIHILTRLDGRAIMEGVRKQHG